MIKQAAIKDENGKIYTLPQPARHSLIIKTLIEAEIRYLLPSAVQGFLTDDNRFVDRIEAMKIARESGQVTAVTDRKELYTEDLW